MANTKLLKVMDYLINEQEDKARELLHQIFIEKARAIHEQMINSDMEEDMMGGDEGEDLARDIESNLKEIDAEEHFGSGTMESSDDMDMEDAEEDLSNELEDEDMEDADDMDDAEDEDEDEDEDMTQVDMDDDTEMHSAHHDEESEGEKIHDLEQAIAELKAEFEALKHDTESTEHAEHEAEVEESWESYTDLDEDYDDLSENMDLDIVQAAKRGEVGSGRFSPAETNTRSPVPPTQTDMMGARPVKTGQGPKASGYDRQSAPDSKSMNLSNRRRDAEDGKHPVSKEGDAAALLNKGTSAGYGAVNTKSPISGSK